MSKEASSPQQLPLIAQAMIRIATLRIVDYTILGISGIALSRGKQVRFASHIACMRHREMHKYRCILSCQAFLAACEQTFNFTVVAVKQISHRKLAFLARFSAQHPLLLPIVLQTHPPHIHSLAPKCITSAFHLHFLLSNLASASRPDIPSLPRLCIVCSALEQSTPEARYHKGFQHLLENKANIASCLSCMVGELTFNKIRPQCQNKHPESFVSKKESLCGSKWRKIPDVL